jgi:hypothetical protein
MVEEPSHVQQRSLNHLRNKGLIRSKTMFVVNLRVHPACAFNLKRFLNWNKFTDLYRGEICVENVPNFFEKPVGLHDF